jgi:tetratricopeptide (TPR) repeat protein
VASSRGTAHAFPECGVSTDNATVQLLKRPADVTLVLVGGAVVLGGAGWPLGAAWAIAGLAAGPFIALIGASIVQALTTPDPSELLRAGRHREALAAIADELPTWRKLARIWPAQFRDALAQVLMNRSLALLAAHRDGEALAAAEQAVEIFRSLAAARPAKWAPDLASALNNFSYPLRAVGRLDEALAAAEESVQMRRALVGARPGKYRYDLAGSLGTQAEVLSLAGQHHQALAATTEAAVIYQDILATDRAASAAAEVLFLHGQLLARLSREREAAEPLARAWNLATRQDKQEPEFDRAVVETAYRADPARFLDTWRAETGTDPPAWLTDHYTAPK